MNKREIGEAYEAAAALFLEKKGVHILERNFRCRQGEIDLIGREGEYLVFFEVKYRKDGFSGLPEEAVGYAKQKRICRAAKYYLYRKHLGESVPVRFDVVAVCAERINWYQNAFDYVE
ncbi:MAG TPA: YraN family protein [Candidatus Eisenbergiella merdipullorum]|uniref:UPF0102 protein H9717_15165 n=1 Tax=Candidatus Eisenbergiella merdipullorum TaxID=2838553 RepID=A0A9D2IAC4_9FIRM|nr:YraN family protein [Candidatus Eisenbergiella merdipullorum]